MYIMIYACSMSGSLSKFAILHLTKRVLKKRRIQQHYNISHFFLIPFANYKLKSVLIKASFILWPVWHNVVTTLATKQGKIVYLTHFVWFYNSYYLIVKLFYWSYTRTFYIANRYTFIHKVLSLNESSFKCEVYIKQHILQSILIRGIKCKRYNNACPLMAG